MSFSASVISYLMLLVLGGLVACRGDACARELIRGRISPGICSHCVTRDTSVSVAPRGAAHCLPITFFFQPFGV